MKIKFIIILYLFIVVVITGYSRQLEKRLPLSGKKSYMIIEHNKPVAYMIEKSKIQYTGSTLLQSVLPAGRGEVNQKIMGVVIATSGNLTTSKLTSINFCMKGTTNLSDVTLVRLYYNGNNQYFDTDSMRNPATQLLGTFTPSGRNITYTGNVNLLEGNNYFYITYDVASDAKEGNRLDGSINTITIDGKTHDLTTQDLAGSRWVALENHLLWRPGQDSSDNYRIPALTTTHLGTVIAAIDKRNNGNADIHPNNNIDIVVKRSTDVGKTWSPSTYVWGQNTTKTMSDPSLLTLQDGSILLMANMGSSFGKSEAYNPSNPDASIRPVACKSKDDGLTWSDTIDLAGRIYAQIPNLVSSFITSGNLLQIKRGPFAGRILGVLVTRYSTGGKYGNHIVYSDDNGVTWSASPNNAAEGFGGDEAKVIELNDGTILLSSRKYNARLFNKSSDGGITWGTAYQNFDIADPNCNGDMIRYTSTLDGNCKDRILHSIPYNIGSYARQNVSLLMSYDEGKTWPVKKTITPGESGYSALTILPDNTIGILYESKEFDGTENEYDIYFTKVSLDWLSNGSDHFAEKKLP